MMEIILKYHFFARNVMSTQSKKQTHKEQIKHTVKKDKIDKEGKGWALVHRNLPHCIVKTREARAQNGAPKLQTQVDNVSSISSDRRQDVPWTLSLNILSDSFHKSECVHQLNNQTEFHYENLQSVLFVFTDVRHHDADSAP